MLFKNYLPFEVQVLLAMIIAFFICFTFIPKIIALARDKHLLAEPVGRSSHKIPTPTLGGIGIYFGFMIPTLLFAGLNESKILPFLTIACAIIFLIGIKDDIYVIAPKTKLMGQIVAAIIMIVFADVRLTSLHGILGIHEIPYIASFLITLFIYIAITNAYNLMDGIDGLAASLGIIGAMGFGLYFMYLERINGAVSCASLMGSLGAFLIYNYAKGDRKIFMGDTGSLMIGFILCTYAIRFNEFTLTEPTWLVVKSAPVVSIAILAIPIFDTLRVFTMRILRGKSPFKADRTHVHHALLANGYSHHQATTVITSFNIVVIILIYYLQSKVPFYPLLLILILSVALFYIVPFTLLTRRFKIFRERLFRKKKKMIESPIKNENK